MNKQTKHIIICVLILFAIIFIDFSIPTFSYEKKTDTTNFYIISRDGFRFTKIYNNLFTEVHFSKDISKFKIRFSTFSTENNEVQTKHTIGINQNNFDESIVSSIKNHLKED